MMSELERLKARMDKMFASGVVDFKVDIKRGTPVEVAAGEINRMLDAAENGECYQIDFGDSKAPDAPYREIYWKPGESSRMIGGVLVYRSYADYAD